MNIWHGHLHVFHVSKTNDNQLAKAEENWVSKKKHNVSQMFWDHFQMPGLVGLAHKKKTFELLKSLHGLLLSIFAFEIFCLPTLAAIC